MIHVSGFGPSLFTITCFSLRFSTHCVRAKDTRLLEIEYGELEVNETDKWTKAV